jgi:hypothetical protein
MVTINKASIPKNGHDLEDQSGTEIYISQKTETQLTAIPTTPTLCLSVMVYLILH